MEGLVLCSANYTPLTPLSFLERAAFVYRKRVALIHGNTSFSWEELHGRCVKLASALFKLGVSPGDIVAAVAPNIPALYELHFSVPMAGAVLSALNPRLDAATLAQLLQQLVAKVIFVYSDFIEIVLQALNILQEKDKPYFLVLIHESSNTKELPVSSPPTKILDYHTLLEMGQSNFKIVYPKNELDPISISFTSGSTGKPKGVVYSHRAAYLNAIADIFRYEMGKMPVFLWTVDMFRCNGWCLPWTVAALGGTNICIEEINGKEILDAIYLHNVTHFCGAPMILSKIADAIATNQPLLPHQVNVTVAGVLPPLEILTKLEELGFIINHAYGMSEALGPMISMSRKYQDDFSNSNEDMNVKIREGIHNIMMEEVDVKDPESMKSVPADGKTTGEIMFRGNAMMLGYLKDTSKTEEAFEGGWYRTKDLGIKYPDGYIQLKDRAVDIIKSGEKFISTLEIEVVLIRHPMVLEAAVVALPDDVVGETPCAFVKLKEGCFVTDEEIIKFCKDWLQDYMVPRAVIFGDLPLNSSGKIQKFILRDKAKALKCPLS
ncbi:PREDICTED: probable acyl-activating enzyme 1, peroxisomal [Nicotiana attenuata]|uniref:Acyl-activating enzyme 1, peroxisomal n=1 Tax=Nicotiana attenuata TaxID=49451 RepID=A0A1J6L8U6_NICAT|nr:PREDICTED: probable acyl-activating enzyme 1, peroxisomal [Nicotiana attenuata]OIT27489.1 putative acyl-activating enzyme 1, peroxisomal [Nicotiana attenuata]